MLISLSNIVVVADKERQTELSNKSAQSIEEDVIQQQF